MPDPLTPVLTRSWLSPKSWDIETYEQLGGYSALRTALTAVPEQITELVKALRSAWPRRRGLPDRDEVVVPAAAG